MFDLETYGILGGIILIISIVLIRIIAVLVVAGAVATYMGLSGLLWCCATFVIFLVINALINGFNK